MNLIIAAFVFICVLCMIEGLFVLAQTRWSPMAKKVRRQLQALSAERSGSEGHSVVLARAFSSVPRLNRMLSGMPVMLKLDRLLLQANSRQSLGVFVLLSLVLGLCGFYAVIPLTRDVFAALPAAMIAGNMPFLCVLMQKKRRMKKFEAQLPEALEMMARSLRAGHAFVGALQTAAQEFDDPMGAEMQKTVAQINFGVSVEQALKNLTGRVDCQDLKFLAVSIIIQRESGGNLTEILESIASLIRERFKLRGKIRALSAEGKLSAIILIALPFAIALMLAVINPAYTGALWRDPVGRRLVFVAIAMMAAGMAVMKKISAIRV
jgi:tight adherence protein B